MPENIDQMKKRHEREIEALQNACRHPKTTKWLEHYWAMAHSSGFQVKHCTVCGKEVNRRVHCFVCGKRMTNYTWDKHFGEYYCKAKCAKNWEELRQQVFEKRWKEDDDEPK